MSSTTGNKTIEDYFFVLAPIVGALAGVDFGGIIPGMSGFMIGAVIGSLAKTFVGLGQNPHPSNYEDWLNFISTFLGFLGTAFSANPMYLTYGLIVGFLLKALGSLKTGFNIEDIVLAIGAIVAGLGQLTGNMTIVTAGILLGVVGKALPSIGTNGSPTSIIVSTPTGTAA